MTAASFTHDAEYAELCGNRKVFDLVSTIESVSNRYGTENFSASLQAKAVGNLVDPKVIKEETTLLEANLRESERVLDYFCKTATHLRNMVSALQDQLNMLKKEEKRIQEEYRTRYIHRANVRLPILPREVIEMVLSHVPADNRLECEGFPMIYLDGLLPHVVLNPSLLRPHFKHHPDPTSTLEYISKAFFKQTVLAEASLARYIKLRVVLRREDNPGLKALMEFPCQWERLHLIISQFSMDRFINSYKICLPYLKKLHIVTSSVTPSTVVPFVEGEKLKSTDLSFNTFSPFYKSGILNSVITLSLSGLTPNSFTDHATFKKALNDLPNMLSQLPRLFELNVWHIKCDCSDLTNLPRVKSISLRSLNVRGETDTTLAFLTLFSSCRIESVSAKQEYIHDVERLFRSVRFLRVQGNVPEILFDRGQNGELAFPEMVQIAFSHIGDLFEDDLPQFSSRVLQTVRIRSEDPAVRSIGHLRLPKIIVPNLLFQQELENYVSSLVLVKEN